MNSATVVSKPSFHRIDGSLFTVSDRKTAVMGILNLTPDSFFDGGIYCDEAAVLDRAFQIVEEGADIIDLGAESTRPSAVEISQQEEWTRLKKILSRLVKSDLPVVLSIDTRHVETAKKAADMGVCILNLPFPDEFSTELSGHVEPQKILSSFEGIVLMHSRGTPKTMQTLCSYEGDLLDRIVAELLHSTDKLTGIVGTLTPHIIYDPGLGFAKDAAQSMALLQRISEFQKKLVHPVLVGASRKSFLGQMTGCSLHDRLAPSLAAALWAAQKGASFVRVHDVKETRSALTVWEKVNLPPEHAAPLSYIHHERHE